MRRASDLLVMAVLLACGGGAGPLRTPVANPGAVVPAPRTDPFGVLEMYETLPGGREWFLPADAERASAEWKPQGATTIVTRVAPGEFHTDGQAGQVRLVVTSPAGKPWWRNFEATAYFRQTSTLASADQVPHWELLGRGERHSGTLVSGEAVNDGVPAPPGTATWPGYPFGAAPVNPRCLGTAYHGNAYPSGRLVFEKELSHTDGYGDHQRGQVPLTPVEPGTWFGMKFVVRNVSSDRSVHLELWIDHAGDGSWFKATEVDDDAGSWPARTTTIDGCGAPPFSFATDQVITWAGPWLTFRSDAMGLDFKWLSVREIAPLP
jgi:hypothetical protein